MFLIYNLQKSYAQEQEQTISDLLKGENKVKSQLNNEHAQKQKVNKCV